jgi:hypothetical protein
MEGLITLSGHRFFTVQGFAKATGKKEGSIYRLIREGNSIRKLISHKFGPNIYIPEAEFYNFPFKMSGKNNGIIRFTAPEEFTFCKMGDLLEESRIRKELEIFDGAIDCEGLEE